MKTVLIITTLLVAIICGIMYGYACSVNPGLAKLRDADYLKAMQEINRAIINPWFMICFIGPLIFYAISGWLILRAEGISRLFILVASSGLIYFVGVFMVTGAGNVPLNEMLDHTKLGALSKENLRAIRDAFEGPWNKWHLIRTVASIVSLALLLVALTRKS